MNSKEFGYPFSKKGYLRGYIKYGVFAYIAWHYTKLALTSHGHHDQHHGNDKGHHSEAHQEASHH